MLRVKKLFTHNPERHHAQFYESAVEPLRNGRLIPYPLGEQIHQWPFGMEFVFERTSFMVLLPEAHDSTSPVVICPKGTEPDGDHVTRAAHLFAESFLLEYKRFYTNAITD